MFENFDYIPGTLIPCNCYPNIQPSGHISKPLEIYNIKNELIGYGWNYGDTIVLEFNTTGTVVYEDTGVYETPDVYFEGKQLQLLVFDFRYETVINITQDASTQAKFYIDAELSSKLVKGVYTFRLILIDPVANTTFTLIPQSGSVNTLYIN